MPNKLEPQPFQHSLPIYRYSSVQARSAPLAIQGELIRLFALGRTN